MEANPLHIEAAPVGGNRFNCNQTSTSCRCKFMNLVFSSKALKHCRSAVEDLLFFNPRQFRVRDGILDSLEKFGHPRVEETAGGLSVKVENSEAQTLFAVDRDRLNDAPIGLVVFLRTSPDEVAIMHLAVHPDYALQGRLADLGLGIILLEKVKEIVSRIVGVRRVTLQYRQQIVMTI